MKNRNDIYQNDVSMVVLDDMEPCFIDTSKVVEFER
jgi:hypothetical protein